MNNRAAKPTIIVSCRRPFGRIQNSSVSDPFAGLLSAGSTRCPLVPPLTATQLSRISTSESTQFELHRVNRFTGTGGNTNAVTCAVLMINNHQCRLTPISTTTRTARGAMHGWQASLAVRFVHSLDLLLQLSTRGRDPWCRFGDGALRCWGRVPA